MIEIKKADLKDFETLAKLISNDIAWSRYGIDYEIAYHLIRSADDEFYVARNGQGVIGFCTLRLNGVGNIGAYIRMIVVSEAHRNSYRLQKQRCQRWDKHKGLMCQWKRTKSLFLMA